MSTNNQPKNSLDIAKQLVKQFETGTAFGRLEEQIGIIAELEDYIVADRAIMGAAARAMDGARAALTVAGLSGKNETERKASLEQFCADDPLYVRGVEETGEANRRIETHEVQIGAAKRRFTAIRLEIEARISSKLLLAGTIKE